MNKRRHRRLLETSARTQWWLVGVLGALALGLFYYFLATRGPRRVSTVLETAAVDRVAVDALSSEIGQLEESYQALRAVPAQAAEAERILTQALDKERELLRLHPRAGDRELLRLERLEAGWAESMARRENDTIEQLLAEAREARSAEQTEVALEKFRMALDRQRAINQGGASRAAKNIARESLIEQQIANIQAEPLAREVQTLLKKAEAAEVDKKTEEARANYESARTLQTRLNREFPRTSHADLIRLDRIDASLASLNAIESAREIDEREAEAGRLLTAGDFTKAAQLFSDAKLRQQTLNSMYSRSRFVSEGRVNELEIRRQTALSAEKIVTLKKLDQEIAGLLARREVPAAVGKIRAAAALAGSTLTEYPRSQWLREVPDAKFGFLLDHSGEIAAIHEVVYGALQPLPNGARMLKTEVAQSLYETVTRTNPSRVAGHERPVDSVSWHDAKVFCHWLSWLLGKPARLPSEREFLDASAEQFSGLIAVPAEWLEADQQSPTAPLAGVAETGDASSLVVTSTPKNERSRRVGFRFVVE